MSGEVWTAARAVLPKSLLVAALGLAASSSGLASAWADPVLPVDPSIPAPVVASPAPVAAPLPVPPPPPAPPAPLPPPTDPSPRAMLGQVSQALQSNPVTAMKDLLASSPQQPLLGQAPVPPETITGGPPPPNPLDAAQLLSPRNYRMPGPDQVGPYALAPNDNPSPFARIDAWKGVHALVHGGLGRMPGDELGQALPGTAPPPGTALPPGLEQFYVDPLLLPPPAPAPPNGAPS